jgi:hypothetical protein
LKPILGLCVHARAHAWLRKARAFTLCCRPPSSCTPYPSLCCTGFIFAYARFSPSAPPN